MVAHEYRIRPDLLSKIWSRQVFRSISVDDEPPPLAELGDDMSYLALSPRPSAEAPRGDATPGRAPELLTEAELLCHEELSFPLSPPRCNGPELHSDDCALYELSHVLVTNEWL